MFNPGKIFNIVKFLIKNNKINPQNVNDIINNYQIIDSSLENLRERLNKISDTEELIKLILSINNSLEMNEIISAKNFALYANSELIAKIMSSKYAKDINLNNIYKLSSLAKELSDLLDLGIATKTNSSEFIAPELEKVGIIFSVKNLTRVITDNTQIQDLETLIQLPPIQRLTISLNSYTIDDFCIICGLILKHPKVHALSKSSLEKLAQAIKKEINFYDYAKNGFNNREIKEIILFEKMLTSLIDSSYNQINYKNSLKFS